MKVKAKCKILINGLFPIENYKIDEFMQKTGEYDEMKVNTNDEDYIFYAAGELVKAMYSVKGKSGAFYEYFENEELIEIDIENEIAINTNLLNEFILDFFRKKIQNLERRLRLITNISIGLPVFRVKIFDENGKMILMNGEIFEKTSHFNMIGYNENMKRILSERLRFNIVSKTIEELEARNSRYKRALAFYNDSFSANDIGVKFVLLFSALESLFNFDPDNVTEYIAKYSSKCLFLDNKKEKKYYYKIKDFYDRRSSYVHGNEPKTIGKEKEFDLREIVRNILLIYWNISLVTKIETAEEMIAFLNENNKDTIEMISQIFIKALDMKEYQEFYENLRNDLVAGKKSIL